MHPETISDLRDIERECLRKFRARAKKLAAANQELSRENAFAKAVTAMPKTAGRYTHAVALLKLNGLYSLPLFE